MLKVAVCCEYPTLHGGERSMLSTLDGLQAAGFLATVVAPGGGPLAENLHARGFVVLPFDTRDRLGRQLPQARRRQRLARLLARHRPHLLHANSISMGRLSGPVAAELGLPGIAHLRDILKLSRRAIADMNCHRRLLAVSRATRDFHVAAGVHARRTYVLYNGVSLQRFQPRGPTGCLHRELGLPPGAPLVGTVGQIGLRKGQDVLLRAAAVLADELPHVHYLIVGQRFSEKEEGRRFETDLHAAASANLAGRVHFLGFRPDVDKILNELTLLAHPARQEPLGRVLLEAAAAGTPVVASDVGGTREIFSAESRSARLVPPEDPHALAAAVAELIVDPPARAELAEAARRRAEHAFDARRAAAELAEHYRAALDG